MATTISGILVAVTMRVEPAGLHHCLPPQAVGQATHLLHIPTTEVRQDSLVPNQADQCAAVIRLLLALQDTVKLSRLPHLHQVLFTFPPPPQAKSSLLLSSSSPILLPKCEADLSDSNLLDLGREAVRS